MTVRLQKTFFNVESLSHHLYPDLNLWKTAKAFIQRWMRKQHRPIHLLEKIAKNFLRVLQL